MDKINKNLGFGFMRLPMKNKKVDIPQTIKMVDAFIDNGFNYFDTAHGYLDGKSELALKESLTSRYPRDKYILADKLSNNFFEKQEDIRPLFQKQLDACGVEYFDFYLMHAQTAALFEKYKNCRAYETAFELKTEGKIRHVGLSFHDSAEVLDKILTEYPALEFVQIQFNYLDFDNPAVQSKAVYDVCIKHNKKVIVMEPVKGGNLVNLPDKAKAIFDELKGGSYASYALRFAASFPDIFMVLSGMSNMEQMEDNISSFKEFKPLNDTEMDAVKRVSEVFKSMNLIPCTACRYCTDGCPQKISIPDLFAVMNSKQVYKNWNTNYYYSIHTKDKGKASDCIGCKKCEKICPQHLKIRKLLKAVAKEFEK